MPSILKKSFSVQSARSFRDSLDRTDPTADTLYLYFGKETQWTDENTPDTPTESVSDEFDTRNAIVGIKKVVKTNSSFVVNRIDWTSGTVYDRYTEDATGLASDDFYVLTSANNVYKCINNNFGSSSIVEPSGSSTSTISTGDGYTWKFMYNLSSSMISTFLTDDWLPVPTGGQRTSFQTSVETASTYSATNPADGHGSSAIDELFATRIMIVQSLDQDESGTFPINDDYRQLGLWLNPRLTSNDSVASGSIYSVNDSNSDIDETTGKILLIDNRSAITRSSEQSETAKYVLQF